MLVLLEFEANRSSCRPSPTPILGSGCEHEYEAQGGRAGLQKLPKLLLALNDLLNSDRIIAALLRAS